MATSAQDTLAAAEFDDARARIAEQTPADAQLSGGAVSPDLAAGSEPAAVATADSAPAAKTTSGLTAPALKAPSTSGTSSPALNGAPVAPHPKKFSAVNINKKFLEKTSSAAASAQPASHPVAKLGISTPKPAPQANQSHSRLVTTKLTAGPPGNATQTAGWSRPSSTTPASTPPVPDAEPRVAVSGSAAPQLPVVGKVITPQLRVSTNGPQHDGTDSSKPAWRIRVAPSPQADLNSPNDFPTAAEAAQARPAPSDTQKEAPPTPSTQKHTLQQDADAFRGVHLDPNASHWDEMEEDDDNFLGGVIEFGDGKQYKVEPTTPSAASGAPEKSVGKDDRFADDFDRSWPRSASGSSLPRQRDLPPHANVTAHAQAPDGNRALFNERSNKLEQVSPPFSRHSGPTHSAFPPSRRDGRPDHAHSLNEGRPGDGARDNVQLLHKPPHSPEFPFTARGGRGPGPRDGMAAASPRSPHAPLDRGSMNGRDHQQAPLNRAPSQTGRDREPLPDASKRRLSNMGPPPLPGSLDRGKELPPHLSQLPAPAPAQRAPSRTYTRRGSTVSEDSQASALPPLSPRAALVQSPVLEVKPPTMGADYEEASKAVMHSAVERARLRRQQEEEEREKEKERARKKAAELEAKTKPAVSRSNTADADGKGLQATEVEVLGVLEDAIKAKGSSTNVDRSSSASPNLPRPPSVRGTPRPAPQQPPSRQATGSAEPTSARKPGFNSAAEEATSWRSSRPSPAQAPAQASPVVPQATPAKQQVAMTGTVAPVEVHPDEVLDVVDFAELGKLVDPENAGGTKDKPATLRASSSSGTARPVASDFFEDNTSPKRPTDSAKSDTGSWRRKGPEMSLATERKEPEGEKGGQSPSLSHEQPRGHGHHHGHETLAKPHNAGHALSPHSSHHGVPRSPRNGSFREPPMSTLDDTMARVRGVLAGMHDAAAAAAAAKGPSTSAAPPHPAQEKQLVVQPPTKEATASKWLPPALRQKSASQLKPAEPLDVITSSEPPRSPKPAWNNAAVHLPKESTASEPIPKKQQNVLKAGPNHVRWDILSFNPPVKGMSRQELSVNEVLFEKVGSTTPKVSLPVPTPQGQPAQTAATPKINLPGPSAALGALVLSTTNQTRKANDAGEGMNSSAQLNTTSCSPPPATPSTEDKVGLGPTSVVETRTDAPSLDSSNGAVVLFAAPPIAGVRDVVVSDVAITKTTASPAGKLPALPSPAVKSPTLPRLPNADISVNQTVSPSALTAKPNGPDPEHLKAVWSQASDKADLPSSNSLEGIADDLSTIPFTLQDVKSEDGGTPPLPTPSGHTKMSMSDVRRAFQQVPTSSSPSVAEPPPPPSPSMTGQPIRKASYGYPPPGQVPPSPAMRPAYQVYPPQMMGSPSPTVVYAQPMSPAPRPMNGPPAPYGQPMWVPVPPGAAPPAPAGMVRALSSPYPTPMMAYPPGATPGVYPPPPVGMMPPPPGTPMHAGRGMPMLSPAPPGAVAMYPGSPVVMQPPMHGYPAPMTPGRGAPPSLPYNGMPASAVSPRPGPAHPVQYGHVPPQSPYMRPPW